MALNACSVLPNIWRTDITSFSSAISVLESGLICRLIGPMDLTWFTLPRGPESLSTSLSLLKWCSLPGGISGWSGMLNVSGMSGHLLPNGELASFMTLLCLVKELSPCLEIHYLDGLISFHPEW